MGRALAAYGEARTIRAGRAGAADLTRVDLLIIGSPTQGGRPTPAVQAFIYDVPKAAAGELTAAAFDTRHRTRLVAIFGYAADRIALSLEAKGIKPATSPEGFFVKGTKGPLKDGEIERAAAWAAEIARHKTG
jgi:flavodoxin